MSDPCLVLFWDVWNFWKETEVPALSLVGLRKNTSWSALASVDHKLWGISGHRCEREIWPTEFKEVQKMYSIKGNVCVCSVAQLCLTLCGPMDCNPAGSSVPGTFQGRILEWVTLSYSREILTTQDQIRAPCISCTCRQIFSSMPPGRNWHTNKSLVIIKVTNYCC